MAESDVQITGVRLYFLTVGTRMPLKFGSETLTDVICARAAVRVENRAGVSFTGWGETPLSVQWVWPSRVPYRARHEAIGNFTIRLADAWKNKTGVGHPLEIGFDFQENVLPVLLDEFNAARSGEKMPRLAALVCLSPFDIALYDAFGMALGKPVYETYSRKYMNRDLSAFIEADPDVAVDYAGQYPVDYFRMPRPDRLPVWHLVGGKDPLEQSDPGADGIDDGYPWTLAGWIAADGVYCLKIKLTGIDAGRDFDRIVRVGEIGAGFGVKHLSADFNCTVRDPEYVIAILDRLAREFPRIYEKILYVEQPFPYELEKDRIDVRRIAARKPLLMDESAHDWRVIRFGRGLGWNGVALKTCKTQTGAVLSLCFAKSHGMTLMVQDLTNPMLAMMPHVLLAAHAGTIMGVECNAAQFYPDASLAEARIHPGLYRRRNGEIDLSTLTGPGFSYRLDAIDRILPSPVFIDD